MMKKILLLLAGLAAAWSATARIELPEIFGDHMVVLQNADTPLWGWADRGARIAVETSWGTRAEAVADDSGRWQVSLPTPAGGYEPQRITISDGTDRLILDDVLVGEVWFASGQSNMEMPLNGFWHCPIEGANEIIAAADAQRDRLRYVKIPKTAAYTPQERVAGRWTPCTTESAPWFSATAYFFAEQINRILDVPVGIVDCSWGGSRVESWSDRALLERYPDVDLSEEAIEAEYEWERPLVMYNAMLHPLAGYGVRGFLWYQGEANVGRHEVYAQRLADMVALWRSRWGDTELPFYYVEIAPFLYDREGQKDRAALLREAQCKAQKLIPQSAMVVTNDLVEPYERRNIHPKNKRDVGKRLAWLALNKTYGKKQIACQSPEFASMEIAGNEVTLRFTHTDEGFNRLDEICGFELCGADRVFRKADARVDMSARTIVLTAQGIAAPVAARYGFGDFKPGNLANVRGLPVTPFRTDGF